LVVEARDASDQKPLMAILKVMLLGTYVKEVCIKGLALGLAGGGVRRGEREVGASI
jgi:hypothetical protein